LCSSRFYTAVDTRLILLLLLLLRHFVRRRIIPARQKDAASFITMYLSTARYEENVITRSPVRSYVLSLARSPERAPRVGYYISRRRPRSRLSEVQRLQLSGVERPSPHAIPHAGKWNETKFCFRISRLSVGKHPLLLSRWSCRHFRFHVIRYMIKYANGQSLSCFSSNTQNDRLVHNTFRLDSATLTTRRLRNALPVDSRIFCNSYSRTKLNTFIITNRT